MSWPTEKKQHIQPQTYVCKPMRVLGHKPIASSYLSVISFIQDTLPGPFESLWDLLPFVCAVMWFFVCPRATARYVFLLAIRWDRCVGVDKYDNSMARSPERRHRLWFGFMRSKDHQFQFGVPFVEYRSKLIMKRPATWKRSSVMATEMQSECFPNGRAIELDGFAKHKPLRMRRIFGKILNELECTHTTFQRWTNIRDLFASIHTIQHHVECLRWSVVCTQLR